MKEHPIVSAVSFLVLLILLAYWKLATMRGILITDDIFTSDIANAHLPYFDFIGTSLKAGEFPLWIRSIYGGFPIFAAGVGAMYPFNLLLFGLLPSYAALNIVLIVTLSIAATGTFLFARQIGSDMRGALLAAVSFAFSGFMVSHLKHVTMLEAVCWFPVGMLIIERSFTQAVAAMRGKFILWLGPVLAMQILSGFTQVALYSGIAYLCYFMFRLLSREPVSMGKAMKGKRKRDVAEIMRRPVLLWFAVALLIGAGLSAIQVVPTYELVSVSQRAGGVTYDYASNYAYDPHNVINFLFPYANGDIGNGTYRGNSIFWEDYGYAGIITLLLALYCSVREWKNSRVRFFAIATITAYVLVLGPNTPLYELVFYAVPGMKFFRFPTRFLFLVDFGLAALAAYGLTTLSGRFSGSQRATVGYLLLAITIVDLFFFQLRQNAIVDYDTWSAPPKITSSLSNDHDLFRVYSPGASEAHKAAFSAARGWESDLSPYIRQREFLQVNGNVLYGISSPEGYIPLTPDYVVDVWGDMNRPGLIMKTASVKGGVFLPTPLFVRIMDLFNVKYVISPWPITSDALRPLPSSGGVLLYQNPAVLPRAFIVGSYRLAASPADAQGILLSEGFDPAREAILYERPDFSPVTVRENAEVKFETYESRKVVLNVKSEAPGLLVLSDTYYPGWKATIDGRESKILKTNLCQRGLIVPGGSHTVTFTFEPASLRTGGAITLGTFMLLVAGTILLRRKRA